MTRFRFAAIQFKTSVSKSDNLRRAAALIAQAAEQGAQVICLPECFAAPYGNEYFREYAEVIPDGPTTAMLQNAAKQHNIIVIGGSMPEQGEHGQLFNTSVVFDQQGCLLATFRKIHLFDVNVPGGISFQESKTLSPGGQACTFDTSFGRFGLGICYDVRFPAYAALLAKRGATFLVFPGAFNMTTGPMHWELLARARAVDNQLYVAMVSPARDESAKYHAFGHSLVCDPFARVLAQAGTDEEIIATDIDLDQVDVVRQAIPIRTQQREDVYGPGKE